MEQERTLSLITEIASRLGTTPNDWVSKNKQQCQILGSRIRSQEDKTDEEIMLDCVAWVKSDNAQMPPGLPMVQTYLTTKECDLMPDEAYRVSAPVVLPPVLQVRVTRLEEVKQLVLEYLQDPKFRLDAGYTYNQIAKAVFSSTDDWKIVKQACFEMTENSELYKHIIIKEGSPDVLLFKYAPERLRINAEHDQQKKKALIRNTVKGLIFAYIKSAPGKSGRRIEHAVRAALLGVDRTLVVTMLKELVATEEINMGNGPDRSLIYFANSVV